MTGDKNRGETAAKPQRHGVHGKLCGALVTGKGDGSNFPCQVRKPEPIYQPISVGERMLTAQIHHILSLGVL